MAEWLGKWLIDEEDIKNSVPSLAKYFPMLTKFYVDSQKMRIVTTLPYEKTDKFVELVTKAYGAFNATNARRAASEALDAWMKKNA